MRLVVRLAGEPLPWRYKDSDRLGNWIDSRPWTGRPTVEVIRVADPTNVEHVLAAVQDAVTAADHGSTGVESVILDPSETASGGFRAAAAAYLNISPIKPLPDLARLITRGPSDRPTMWLVPLLTSERPQVVHETESFLDLLTKTAPGARLGVVFTDTPKAPLTGRCHDLTTGGPAAGTDLLTTPDARLWPLYLHRRLAWEAGGRQSRAERLDAAVDAAGLRVGDDAGFEAVLTRESVETYDCLDPAVRARTLSSLETCVSRTSPIDSTVAEHFWNPGHLAGTAPVPWVARALLGQEPTRPFAEFLRGSLLCLPISQELLTACFLMETHIRGRVRLPPNPPADAACHEPWRRFTTKGSLAADLYPQGSPTTPTGPWAFASLGEILIHELAQPAGNDWRHQVRELRNHLAHGHHAGWEAVRLTRRLASRLAR